MKQQMIQAELEASRIDAAYEKKRAEEYRQKFIEATAGRLFTDGMIWQAVHGDAAMRRAKANNYSGQ